ncbi:MAG: radical SAM protein [Theionarchaea archaeon]|nr:radical SAM protein [Theionarchaea archaeon]MBU7001500.1 radical SAM protein [Theionarchaea archaeon]MBU7022439.1 radical SAM protein [Theionarchaea archaeon]MBU7034438.1 radical SAM protein [Theionarchaea archaeon]MBU7040649.1 radical SAM protein [Theionarchaea archaeon]
MSDKSFSIENENLRIHGTSLDDMLQIFDGEIPLQKAQIECTLGCNLNCLHCSVSAGQVRKDELSFGDILRFIDEFYAEGGLYIVISGGEPFSRSDTIDIIEYATDYGLSTVLLTNGTLLNEEMIERLSQLKIYEMQFSVDGLRETHDRFRNTAGCFDKTLKSIRIASEKFKNTRILVKSTVSKFNVHEIKDVARLAIDTGADMYAIQSLMPCGRAWQLSEHYPSPGEILEVVRSLIGLFEENPRYSIGTQVKPVFLPVEVPSFFPYLGSCLSPTLVGMDSRGDIAPCSVMTDTFLRAGNIKRKGLRELWRNSGLCDKVMEILKREKKGICKKCYFKDTCSGVCKKLAIDMGDIDLPSPLCQQLYDSGLFPEKYLLT